MGIEFFLDRGLSITEVGHFVVRHRFSEFFVDFVKLVHEINGFLHAFLDNLLDRLCVIQNRFLFKKTDRESLGNGGFAVELGIDSCQDL